MGTSEKASNKAQELKGKLKEAVGKVTGKEDLEREGVAEQREAAIRNVGESVKDAAAKVKDAAAKVKDTLTRDPGKGGGGR
jgi:uncharacterized protein YjbJ (UPF0337 family)